MYQNPSFYKSTLLDRQKKQVKITYFKTKKYHKKREQFLNNTLISTITEEEEQNVWLRDISTI